MHLVSALPSRLLCLLRRWGADRTGSMFVEFALLMPLVMGIMLALINLAIAHQIKMVAAMAVAEGARTAAVQFLIADVDPQGKAAVKLYTKLFSEAPCSNPTTIMGFGEPVVDLQVGSGSGVNEVGALITVTQEWCVLNMFGGLLSLWGGGVAIRCPRTSQVR